MLSHAIESYTALPFNQRPMPDRPALRPAYQGSNPVSDVWSLEALRLVAEYLPRAVEDPSDDVARSEDDPCGVVCRYWIRQCGRPLAARDVVSVSGMIRDYQPAGYALDHALVPHGVSVILNAPAVFRFTASACPERHLHAAKVLGADYREPPMPTQERFRGSNHRIHAATEGAEWTARSRLRQQRYSCAGQRNAAAASRDEAFSSSGH